jgi:hypothetical protein
MEARFKSLTVFIFHSTTHTNSTFLIHPFHLYGLCEDWLSCATVLLFLRLMPNWLRMSREEIDPSTWRLSSRYPLGWLKPHKVLNYISNLLDLFLRESRGPIQIATQLFQPLLKGRRHVFCTSKFISGGLIERTEHTFYWRIKFFFPSYWQITD